MIRLTLLLFVVVALLGTQSLSAQNLLNGPQGCIYDSEYNRYLVTNFWDSSVVEIDSLGNQRYFATGLGRCLSVCIKDTIVYVSTENSLLGLHVATGQKLTLPLTGLPSPVTNFDGLATDTSGNLYMVDVGGRIIKIRLSDYTCTRFVSSGLATPVQDMVFDIANNRLLVGAWMTNAPIQAVQIVDSTVSTALAASAGYIDGLAIDRFGNVYMSHSTAGKAYRYRRGFTKPPELIWEGHNTPSGLDFNNRDDVLAVPNFYINRFDLIPVDFYPEVNRWDFGDDVGGDGDGICEAGETIDLVASVANIGRSEVGDVHMRLLPSSAAIIVTNTEAYLGEIPSHDSADNSGSPFTFTIPIDHIPSLDSFCVELSYNKNGLIVDTFGVRQAIGAPRVLLVDDDDGDSLERFYRQSLEHFKIPYVSLDASQPFSASDLSGYDLIIWFTGDERAEPISPDDIAAMQSLMDTGGKLFLTGQRIAAQLAGWGQSGFLNDYLRCTYLSTAAIPTVLSGADGSRMLTVDDSIWIRGWAGANNQTAPDHISGANGGVGELVYVYQTDLGAVSYIGAYQLLFFSFGFEGIIDGNPQYRERDTVLAHILDFFQYRQPTAMQLTVSPGSQMRLTNHTPSIEWSYEAPGYAQQAFYVQVGSDVDWAAAEMWDYGPSSGSNTSVIYTGSELMDGNDYFYRVRVNDGSQWSCWYYGQMRMNAAPTPPVDIAPDNGLELPEPPPYLLSHGNAADADGDPRSYSYAVYYDSLMTTLVAQASDQPENPGGTTSWQIPTPLPSGAEYFWRVRAGDGYEYGGWSDLASFRVGPAYTRGDANGDAMINLADAVFLVNYVFKGGSAPVSPEAGDANCDDQTNLADAVYVINYVFKGGPAPDCPNALPVPITADVGEITQTTAQCGGTITSDGGATVTARGVCWSAGPTPTVTDDKTIDGSGVGSFASTITGLTGKTTYYAAAYATNSVGTGYGSIKSFTTTDSLGTVTDIDGTTYRTVKIGDQWWMAENLNVTHYRNGDLVPNVTDSSLWTSQTIGAYCNYGNDAANAAAYGRLYNWYAAGDARDIAPAGWHVPSDVEWQTLVNYLGGDAVAGWKMKETGTAHWLPPNTGTDESGFTALPGGYRGSSYGVFGDLGNYACFWSSTVSSGTYAWYRSLSYDYSEVSHYDSKKHYGFSIRCVKN